MLVKSLIFCEIVTHPARSFSLLIFVITVKLCISIASSLESQVSDNIKTVALWVTLSCNSKNVLLSSGN